MKAQWKKRSGEVVDAVEGCVYKTYEIYHSISTGINRRHSKCWSQLCDDCFGALGRLSTSHMPCIL